MRSAKDLVARWELMLARAEWEKGCRQVWGSEKGLLSEEGSAPGLDKECSGASRVSRGNTAEQGRAWKNDCSRREILGAGFERKVCGLQGVECWAEALISGTKSSWRLLTVGVACAGWGETDQGRELGGVSGSLSRIKHLSCGPPFLLPLIHLASSPFPSLLLARDWGKGEGEGWGEMKSEKVARTRCSLHTSLFCNSAFPLPGSE